MCSMSQRGFVMRRLFTIAFIAAIAAVAVGGAQGGSAHWDYLIGLAERPGAVPTITIDEAVFAVSGPNGENATGFFAGRRPEGDAFPFSGKITCLRAEGNRAVAGGVVTKSESPFSPVGSWILIHVTDNGFPGAGLA